MEHSNIEQSLDTYSEAFDFYMECGKMPDSVDDGDLLGEYVKSVIDQNPQLELQDDTWKDVLKEDLMRFLEAMLIAFAPIEQERDKEQDFITKYEESDIQGKRDLWRTTYNGIKGRYSAEDVNIDSYANQFSKEDKDSVFDSLINDWRKACDERCARREKALLERSKNRWEQHIRDWGTTDYKRKRKTERIFFRYPELQEIVRIMGREQPENKQEKDDITMSYIPIITANHISHTDIEQISPDNDLNHLLPTETTLLSEPTTEPLFYKKYASKQLQTFSNRPEIKSQKKQEQKHQDKPRLEMGPIIVSLDTSGSMMGKPEELAQSLLIQLLKMAKQKKRKCFLISFSVRAKYIELTSSRNWYRLNDFLNDTFSGGTDGEEMLAQSIRALKTKDFCMADVLIISDFYFPLPLPSTMVALRLEHNKGTRFYGLQIGTQKCEYERVLDKVWKVKIK